MTGARRELPRKATISDVAARAGVSIKTVSRVLNSEPKVRPSTGATVEDAMRALRYRPNSPGRMLASRRSWYRRFRISRAFAGACWKSTRRT